MTSTTAPSAEPLHPDLIPEEGLPDYNNVECDFTCGIDGDDTKCTITAGEMTFNGRWDEETGTVTFLPIQYAEHPSGSKRWAAPEVIKSYDTPQGSFDQDAKENRPQCMTSASEYEDGTMTEDCLYLKIETPRLALENKEKKSVVIFIHGGGWRKGWGMGDGRWNEVGNKSKGVQNQDVVYISMNYRLSVFGFLHLDASTEEFKGNWGYQDQIAAMKWVHSFAGLFGGDRDQVTITGWSAGGAAVWNHLANKAAWPYFHRAAPMGASMNAWHASGNNLANYEKRLWNASSCTTIECLRGLTANKIINACVDDKCIAKSIHKSETVGVPETLFNAFLNGNTRPNTPLLWTIACDDNSDFQKDWYLKKAGDYFTSDEKTAIKADQSNDGVDKKLKCPSPYMNTYLERWFGTDDLGERMKDLYGCPDGSINCHDQIMEFTVAQTHICPSLYALRTLYGDANESGGANFYPVEFCQHLPDGGVDGHPLAYANCDGKYGESDKRACHGAEQGYVFGQEHDTNDFGKAVSDAYGAFFRDGFIPAGERYSINNLEDANFGMNFLKSAEDFNSDGDPIAGVPLPWTENQDVEVVRDRVAQCAVMNKVHEKYDYYKADGGYQWSEAPGYNDVN